jgi:hypothetical protein
MMVNTSLGDFVLAWYPGALFSKESLLNELISLPLELAMPGVLANY